MHYVCPTSDWPAANDMKWTPAALNRDRLTPWLTRKHCPLQCLKHFGTYCDCSQKPTSIRYINFFTILLQNKIYILVSCTAVPTVSQQPHVLRFSCNSSAGICPVMIAEHCNTESKNQFLYKCLFLTLYETTLRIFSIRTSILALSLFVFWVFADYSDATLSLNDFALFTNWFYRRSNLHFISLLSKKVHLLL